MPPRWRRRQKHLSIVSGIALSLVEVDARDVQGLVEVDAQVFVVAIVLAAAVVVVMHHVTIWLDSSFNSLNEAVLCMTQPLT